MHSLLQSVTARLAAAATAGTLALVLLPAAGAAVPAAPPSSPATVGARGADAAATVSWTAPHRGARKVTAYLIEWSIDGGASWPAANQLLAPASAMQATVQPLVNGIRYSFRVTARSLEGDGRPTAPVTATPVGPPGVPTNLTVEPGDGSLTVRWSAPQIASGAQAVRDYLVEWSTTGQAWQSKLTTDTWTTIFDLTNGSRYQVRVSARGRGGAGAPATSDRAVKPRTTPSAPASVTAVGGTRALTISWTPGDSGGVPIRAYRVRWVGSDQVRQEQLVDAALTSLTASTTAGQTRVTVAAINSVGAGPTAAATTKVWDKDISEPRAVTVEANRSGATLAWQAPLVTAGLTGTAIAIRFTAADGTPLSDWQTISTAARTETSAFITAAPGSSAIFRLRSLRKGGEHSRWTPPTPVRSITSARPLPTDVVLTHDLEGRELTASWSPADPAAMGAANITGYEVEYRRPASLTWTSLTGDSPQIIDTSTWGDGDALLRVRSILGSRTSAWVTATTTITSTVPGPPSAAGATGGSGEITVTWTPGSTGGLAIEVVVVRYRSSGSASWLPEVAVPGADVPGGTSTLTGITPGSWEVQLAMVNAKGTGTWVPAGTVTST